MSLWEDINNQPVSDLKLRQIITVLPNTPIRQVIRKMRDARLGCAILVDEYDKPVAKFTERTLINLLAVDPATLDDAVEQHSVPLQGCVSINDSIVKVFDYINRTDLRFVCVVDEEGKLCGLTGQRGLMEYIAEHFPRQVMVQMMESKLYMDQREGA